MPSFAFYLPKLARCGVARITVAVTEKHARKVLGIKPPKPLEWCGTPLNCIGSAAYRRRHAQELKDSADQPGG